MTDSGLPGVCVAPNLYCVEETVQADNVVCVGACRDRGTGVCLVKFMTPDTFHGFNSVGTRFAPSKLVYGDILVNTNALFCHLF